MTDSYKIIDTMRRELALQRRYLKLLDLQKTSLLACDRKKFTELQPEQETIVATLAANQDLRQKLFRMSDGQPVKLSDLLPTMPQRLRDAAVELREELKRVVADVTRISDENQTLIENELGYISFMMDSYVDASRKADKYAGLRSGRRLMLDKRI